MNYDVDYFLNKFEAIPEEKWKTNSWKDSGDGRMCAHGHCGRGKDALSQESLSLNRILGFKVIAINDGWDERYQQPTPKQRILAALMDIKAMTQPVPEAKETQPAPQVKVEKVYVPVIIPETIVKQTKELIYQ